jgi:hypothetical protein
MHTGAPLHCGEHWQILAALLEAVEVGGLDDIENVVKIGRGSVLVTFGCYFP